MNTFWIHEKWMISDCRNKQLDTIVVCLELEETLDPSIEEKPAIVNFQILKESNRDKLYLIPNDKLFPQELVGDTSALQF